MKEICYQMTCNDYVNRIFIMGHYTGYIIGLEQYPILCRHSAIILLYGHLETNCFVNLAKLYSLRTLLTNTDIPGDASSLSELYIN